MRVTGTVALSVTAQVGFMRTLRLTKIAKDSLMPNNKYLRSTKRERELVNKFRADGWDACRSAGSHSPWDVWAFNPNTKEVILIQVKTKKGARGKKVKFYTRFEPATISTYTMSYE
jgi:hypothetical protein